MRIANKLMMVHIAVSDMPKAKALYVDKLGLTVVKDYRQDDANWWVELALPEGGVHLTLTTHHAHMQPGTLTLYFATSDIAAAHRELQSEGIDASAIGDDLHGPGSGTKWFSFHDTDDNLIHIEQA